MTLSPQHQKLLAAVRNGVETTDSYLHQLTDYHGGPLQTEYVLTTDISRALLTSNYAVATEFLINRIQNHLYYRENGKVFPLGSRRFDVAALDAGGLPELVVEVKIGVSSLAKIRTDLSKILEFLECARSGFANRFLGLIVFQVHRGTTKYGRIKQVSSSVKRLERGLANDLADFAAAWPAYELSMEPLQGSDDRIYPDEVILEENDEQTLGRTCHATRYHAITIKKRITEAELEQDSSTSQYRAKKFQRSRQDGTGHIA